MRILYAASTRPFPGTTADRSTSRRWPKAWRARPRGARRSSRRRARFPSGGVRWIAMPPPLGGRNCGWANAARSRSARAAACGPTSIIERYHNFGGEGDRGCARRRRARACSKSTRRSSTIRARPRRCSIARCSSSRCGAGASSSASIADLIVTPSAAILPPADAAAKSPRARMGRRHRSLSPGAAGAVAVRCGRRRRPSRCSPARSATGTARSTSSTALRELRARGRSRHRRGVHRRRPGAAAGARRGRAASTRGLHRRAAARRMPAVPGGVPTSASRRSIRDATRRCRSASTGRR